MPKRTDIQSILVIGAGPIVIGQACEFDYSGTQACKALKEEGYKVILINSNPATIMTDPGVADIIYIEPLTLEFVTKIIKKERPCAILPTAGGQTALNLAMQLASSGLLKNYNVELIGANEKAIEKAENRQIFKEAIHKIGLKCPKNIIARSIKEADKFLEKISLPAIIRPSYTLGGAGGGIAYNKKEFIEKVKAGLAISPTTEVLIDESIIGWKEYEMEVVRDKADNCILVCSIENIDPMGVHTGDSITVAPALTLTDKEFQKMRNASFAILREIGVDTGGANVQFAINPSNGEMLVIEMNPRVSRSSALASKATGFPIAKVAAKLAIGYTLDEITNDCTGSTPASFEPVIDYVVTKIPRFSFDKLGLKDEILTTSMKSVGEVMAMGRSFSESIQKALRSLEIGLTGFNEVRLNNKSKKTIRKELAKPRPDRLLLIGEAIRAGITINDINAITHYDLWFLDQIRTIIEEEHHIKKHGLPKTKHDFYYLKQLGFSDARLGELCNMHPNDVMKVRHKLNVRPVYKRVDTCAAEFESQVAYLYSTYEGNEINGAECESKVSHNKTVIIIGSGPNRIGQGIEFDYACVHAAYALKELGIEAIMINCNPETVSTDYNTCDKLYFEPLTHEDVLEIIEVERANSQFLGVIIQLGGQTPLKLAAETLSDAQISILGTPPESIDLAEDRERFKQLLQKLNLNHPRSFSCNNIEDLNNKAALISYPVIVRPSYVLGGRAMKIINNYSGLISYVKDHLFLFSNGPILIEEFVADAIEVDVDAISDGTDVCILGVMEHIEEAGIHSGDSSCSLPPYSIRSHIIEEIKRQTKLIALKLRVVGLLNIQFAIKGNNVLILEVNPRASRTLPFVAKSTGIPVIKIASFIMLGQTLQQLKVNNYCKISQYFSVKIPVFSFSKFRNIPFEMGPEMKSTGEVMGIDSNFYIAYYKGLIASGNTPPLSGNVLLIARKIDHKLIEQINSEFMKVGFKVFHINEHNQLSWTGQNFDSKSNRKSNITSFTEKEWSSFINKYRIELVAIVDPLTDLDDLHSYIFRATLAAKILCVFTAQSLRNFLNTIKYVKQNKRVNVKPLQEYIASYLPREKMAQA